jgi:hypothetical protein
MRKVTDFGSPANGSATLQAFVDAVTQPQVGTPAHSGDLSLEDTPYPNQVWLLDQTVTISRGAVQLLGAGVGNPANYPSAPGRGTTFKWVGPAGVPMFNVKDSAHGTFQDILFLGDNTSPPSCGIFFEEPAGGSGMGTNRHHLVRRCYFGRWTWTAGGLEDGQIDIGLRWGGNNTNNDQYVVEDCVFRHCTQAAIKVESTQSIWGCMRNIQTDNCGVAIDTVAAVNLFNLACNRSTVADLVLGSSAIAHVRGLYSEHAALIFRLTSNGSALFVDGGHVQMQTEMTGPNWGEHLSVGAAGGVVLRGLRINNSAGGAKRLYARGNSSSVAGYVRIEECPHQGPYRMDQWGNYDIQAGTGTGGIVVTIDTGPVYERQHLLAGAALSPW